MAEYDNTDTGALFKNEDKQTDKHPDYKGSINVGGQEFWLSAWLKTSKKGTKFMSLSVKAKDDKAPAKSRQTDDDPDSIPF